MKADELDRKIMKRLSYRDTNKRRYDHTEELAKIAKSRFKSTSASGGANNRFTPRCLAWFDKESDARAFAQYAKSSDPEITVVKVEDRSDIGQFSVKVTMRNDRF